MAKSVMCVAGNVDTQYEGYTNGNGPYKDFFNVVVTQGVKQQDGGRENMSFDFGFIRITFDYFS